MNPFIPFGRAGRGLTVGVFGFLSLASLVAGYYAGHQQILVGLGFLVYASVAVLPALSRNQQLGWLHPLVFMVLWWGLARYVGPLLPVIFGGLSEHFAIVSASDAELNAIAGTGFLLSALGLVAFYFGFVFVRPIRLSLPKFGAASFPFIKTALIVGLSVMALLFLAREAGGLETLLLQRGIGRELRVEVDLGGRHWHFMTGLGTYACLIWFAFSPRIWRSPRFIFLFSTSLAITFAATGSRTVVLIPIFMAGVMWSLHNRRLPTLAITVMLIFGIFFVGIGGQFRELSRGATSVNIEELDTSVADQVSRGVENVFRYGTEIDGLFAILANVPDRMPLLYGESYVSVFFIVIPSTLLPFDKPPAGGQIVATRLFNLPNSGVPPGNIGEAYMNFHIPGVVVVMFVFGAVMRVFSQRFATHGDQPIERLLFVLTLFLLQPNTTAIFDWVQSVIVLAGLTVFYCGLPFAAASKEAEPRTL